MNIYYGCEFLHLQRIMITERYKYVFNGFDLDEFIRSGDRPLGDD